MPNLMKNMDVRKGFTMIETLVAVFILMLAITGPLYFVSQSLQSAYYARDQVTAFYLTQESVELVKNIRDTNALTASCDEAQYWLSCNAHTVDDLTACTGAYGCVVGLTAEKAIYVAGCSSDADSSCVLRQNTGVVDELEFSYGSSGSGWSPARFQKRVYIEIKNEAAYVGGSEAEVVVRVNWRSGTIDREFVVRQNITNWVPIYPLVP